MRSTYSLCVYRRSAHRYCVCMRSTYRLSMYKRSAHRYSAGNMHTCYINLFYVCACGLERSGIGNVAFAAGIATQPWMANDMERERSPCVWYRANECPFVGKCTHASWKKAACAGWTREDARDKVYKHLANSSLHQVAEEVAKAAAASVHIEEVVWTASEMEAWDKSILENEKTKTERKKRKAEIHDERDAPRPSQAQRVAPSILRLGSLTQIGQGEATADVEVRVGQVRGAMDALSRGADACNLTANLLLQASNTFAEEAERMTQCRDSFRRSLDDKTPS